MKKQQLLFILLLSLSTLNAYEITIDKTIKLKVQVDSEFKRDAQKQVVIDTKRNLMWQDNKAVTTTEKSEEDAKQHCNNLNHAGYMDWYLPTIKELETIAQSDNEPRAIGKIFKYTMPSAFWSSSANVSGTNDAWYVDFKYGDSGYSNKYYNGDVRCVRAGQ